MGEPGGYFCAGFRAYRDFLDVAIRDYNEMFHTNYSTDGDNFQNYYKDVSLRMKNRELDLLIVVNMFLTGFDDDHAEYAMGGQKSENAPG